MSSSIHLGDKSQNTLRSASYSTEEDQLLCHVYLDVSQNPIIGTNQSINTFWSCIEAEYHKALPMHITNVRPRRSLQSRWQVITAAIGKLRGCIRQIENLNPSGASEQDILNRAKMLLAQDPNFKKGFKFDHVWPLLKDTEKYAENNSSQSPTSRKRNDRSEASQSDSTTSKNANVSSFNIDLNEDFESDHEQINCNHDLSARPVGRNKAKMKKKQGEEMAQYFKSMQEENQHLTIMFKETHARMDQTQSLLQKNYELQLLRAQNESKKIEAKQRREEAKQQHEENKILARDVDSIKDPILRDAIRNEQIRICEKRAQEQQFYGGSGSSNAFTQNFGGYGGNGDDLPEF